MSQLVFPRILWQDSFLAVIDKPVGWVVNRAESVRGLTIQDWVEDNFQVKYDSKSVFGRRSGTVHRLDKVTSGVLIVAKTEAAFVDLQAQFKARTVSKEYFGLAHGQLSPEGGLIDMPVGRKFSNRKEFGVILGGRPAQTKYQTMKVFISPQKNPVSLLLLQPKTGRTHQLRVHLKYVGHPLVGDPVYAGRKNIRNDRDWCPRLFLHARKIEFTHPQTKKRVVVESELPNDLSEVLKRLREQ